MRSFTDIVSGGCEMKGNLQTIVYAAVLGAICGSLLAGANQLTEPYKKANAQAERIRNVLEVLQIRFSKESGPQELAEVFSANVSEEKFGELPVYVHAAPQDKGKVKSVAVAFEGRGLWGPIRGFLALRPDMRTIQDITFYEQEETPGLGGQITSSWFRERFKSRRIIDADGKSGIRIRRAGGHRAENEVDAITGATMTCKKVEEILNETIEKIVRVHPDNAE
jgi:Na+-transporting NADH:ubiquinone oxidoreductase subunit C